MGPRDSRKCGQGLGIKEVADDFDKELRRKFGHCCSMKIGRDSGGGTSPGSLRTGGSRELVLPPLPEFEKHCNFRTDEEIAEMMAQRSAHGRRLGRSTTGAGPRWCPGVAWGAGRGRSGDKPRFKPTQKVEGGRDARRRAQIKPAGTVWKLNFGRPTPSTRR